LADIALGLCFVLIPLALRWITAWQMGRYSRAALRGDEEYRKLAGELNEIRDAIHGVERRRHQYASRRSHLRGQIEAARTELAALRRPAENRIAA